MTESTEGNLGINDEDETRQKLLWNVKREVKQIMEEAVMKKCIHEENCCVTTLCAAVEACLLHGLKRRAVGLFKSSTTMALLQKIGKTCPAAAEVVKCVEDEQRGREESRNIFSFSKKLSITDDSRQRSNWLPMYNRYMWIRTALIHRSLHKIVEYIVNNAAKFYENYALVYNCVQGPIFASLLVGPCALEFTRVKTSDHFWSDPHADELVQRHRIHTTNRSMSNVNRSHSPKFRPRLQINLKRHASGSAEETQRANSSSSSLNPARDYVESLHQNSKSQLIYGKNNVLVQPIPGRDPLPGYLSLHLNQQGLTLKWTPNQLMNGYNSGTKSINETSQENSPSDPSNANESAKRNSVYWDYAISVNMSSIVYLHCHQHVDGDRIVLVGRDGVQYPPLHIKDKGGHLIAFLSCLETGLAPHGQLDPPLSFEKEQGKILPKIQRRVDKPAISLSTIEDDPYLSVQDDHDGLTSNSTADYVFRLIFSPEQESLSTNNSNRYQWSITHCTSPSASSQSSVSPPMSSSSGTTSYPTSPLDISSINSAVYVPATVGLHKSTSVRTSMASLCDTMRRQILSRAFYGWLAYCRHLKTVRLHLTSLVNPIMIDGHEPFDDHSSLTVDRWNELFLDREENPAEKEIYRRVFSGGCDPQIRRQVWPFLFSHYPFESTRNQREQIDQQEREKYQTLLNECKELEEIITKIDLQRSTQRKNTIKSMEMEIDAARSPLKTVLNHLPRQCSTSTSNPLERKDSNISNDVFYEDCSVQNDRELTEISSYSSVIIARTRTESIIDRSSPYNIIETSTDEEEKQQMDLSKSIEVSLGENQSPGSSLTSGTDVYMDAVDALDEENPDEPTTPVDYGSFSKETVEAFALNLHRIDKDVARCDRNYPYFMYNDNLNKLRNIMCTYVWENLTTGYIQGMCDLVAPFLVIFDEEIITYSCFSQLMKRLLPNFPHGTGMDEHFAHMRSLLQILDSELYEHIHRTGDFTHFYFCYRWFLLDFKREFVYDDIFLVWEIIAAARQTVSQRFVLFIALAMMKTYREIILDHRMDFTDIIKFFNEMAERHDAREILRLARELVFELQKLIDNK